MRKKYDQKASYVLLKAFKFVCDQNKGIFFSFGKLKFEGRQNSDRKRKRKHSYFYSKKNFDEREQGFKYRKMTVNRIKQRKEKWKKTKQ